MYKLAKIFCKNISNYRHFNPRVTYLLLGSVASRGPNVRLSVPQIKFNKPKCKIVNPGNVTLAISILTWLGFADEDAGKESELIMTLKRAVLCMQREEYDKAERMLHLALRIAQQQQNEQGIIYCYDLMANLAFDQYQLDKAEKLFVSVLQMLLSKGVLQDDLKVKKYENPECVDQANYCFDQIKLNLGK
ncbi:hypothetical protein NQ318_015201 [Aromia moschata]|uniref:Uncharacterized protein n=1 Tax=Aromia moschata TaxID=1265417 RepID=A0AAV8XMI9_9CUCU|nr:hypothetical protein NQ318_015201 [Aromia moschata]